MLVLNPAHNSARRNNSPYHFVETPVQTEPIRDSLNEYKNTINIGAYIVISTPARTIRGNQRAAHDCRVIVPPRSSLHSESLTTQLGLTRSPATRPRKRPHTASCVAP